jgi:glycosyltransferase involved in cell wall biosynthesis
VLLSEHDVLRELCLDYGERLLACDPDGHAALPYAWDTLENGLAIDPILRRLYRREIMEAEQRGTRPPPDLTHDGGVADLMSWLADPVPPRGFPRYVEAILTERPDVLHSYGELLQGEAEGFISWLRNSAPHEVGTGRRLATVITRALGATPGRVTIDAPPRATMCVDVIGLFEAESGVGEAARRTAHALRAARVRHRTVGWYTPCRSRRLADVPADELNATLRSDLALLHVNADVLPVLVDELGSTVLDDKYRIGVWFWELADFPDHLCRAFEHVDEVWVASEFERAAIAARAPVPVVHIPLPLSAPPVDPVVTRHDLGFGDDFVFLFLFDLLSVIERKNPFDLIDAYTRAFAPGDQTRLVIKTINGDSRVNDLERLRFAAMHRSDIEIRDGYVQPGAVGALMASADCYVSLHRSEGLGLTIADAMSLGTPVIATAYSGNMDFTTTRNSWLVGYELTPVGAGNGPYDPDAKWAQPDVAEAAALMRRVVERPGEAQARALVARRDLARRFSPDLCGRMISRRIAEVRMRVTNPVPVP